MQGGGGRKEREEGDPGAEPSLVPPGGLNL